GRQERDGGRVGGAASKHRHAVGGGEDEEGSVVAGHDAGSRPPAARRASRTSCRGLAGFLEMIETVAALCRAVEPLATEVQRLRQQGGGPRQSHNRHVAELTAKTSELRSTARRRRRPPLLRGGGGSRGARARVRTADGCAFR